MAKQPSNKPEEPVFEPLLIPKDYAKTLIEAAAQSLNIPHKNLSSSVEDLGRAKTKALEGIDQYLKEKSRSKEELLYYKEVKEQIATSK